MKQKTKRLLSVLLAVLLITALAIPAWATDGPGSEIVTPVPEDLPAAPTVENVPETQAPTQPTIPETEAPTTPPEPVPEPEAETEPPTEPRSMFRFTPDGSLTLVDDFDFEGLDADGKIMSKQMMTVQTRDGNVFWIIIDRTGDTENVYFLNQVDLADLQALVSNESQTLRPTACTCTTTCVPGSIDISCPVCSVNMTACEATQPVDWGTNADAENNTRAEDSKQAETPQPQAGSSLRSILLLVLAVVIILGLLLFAFKDKLPFGGKRPAKKDPLAEYDLDEDDDDLLDDDGDGDAVEGSSKPEPTSPLTHIGAPNGAETDGDSEDEYGFEDDSDVM